MTASEEEQEGLRDAVRTLLAKRSGSAAVRAAMVSERGYDEQLWGVLCGQIGVAALAIPEKFGGAGAGLLETHLVLEELGRTLTPTPLLGSSVLAAQLLLALDDGEACERLLPGIADGGIAAVCWTGPDGHWDPAGAAVVAADRTLTGRAHYVLDGDIADVLLVVAREGDDIAAFEVEPMRPGVTRNRTKAMDPTRRLATVSFDAVPGRRIGGGDATAALRAARDAACVALSAEQVGAASRILELTVEYAKVRVQFGRPIGSFQALKHRMADLYVLVEAARSASYGAAHGTLDAAVAKAYCAEAFFTVAAEAIQLHGGIAITWEHYAHLYFKRAHGSAQLFGQPSEHVARMAVMAGIEEQ
jgi:alkylation response protein AidB-like acyl-CoA dehydrogenase